MTRLWRWWVRLLAGLVPGAHREEWIREWHGEFGAGDTRRGTGARLAICS